MSKTIQNGDSHLPVRLPGDFVPYHYTLNIQPDLEKATFEGFVDIDLKVNRNSNTVTLHTQELDIYNVQMTQTEHTDPVYFQAPILRYNVNSSTVDLLFDSQIKSGGKVRLSMKFRGNINTNKRVGLYQSNLTNQKNQTYSVLSTHFEPHHARRVFPCWDEPGYKATYDVILNIPQGLTALSNNEAKSLRENHGWKQYYFKRTPIMSTYTLAFVVGNLEFIEGKATGFNRKTPVTCRVYTVPGFSNKAHFTLDAMIKSLNYFEEYFDEPYAMKKLDLVALPRLDASAMENWGLITMQNEIGTVDDESSLIQRTESLMITLHELSHQWIGNLVTMKWWDDFWLNEAFANYFGTSVSDVIYPKYNMSTYFHDVYLKNLKDLSESQLVPVRTENFAFEEYQENESTIIYDKGAVTINILNHLISESKFKEIIRVYIKSNRFKNVKANDFYSLLPTNSSFDAMNFAKTWIESKNYPYLNVKQDRDNSQIIITQVPVIKEESQLIWDISITLTINSNEIHSQNFIMSKKIITVPIPNNANFILNTNSFGYIRVNYPQEVLKNVFSFNSITFKPKDQARVLDDFDFFVKKNLVDSTLKIDFISDMSRHKDINTLSLLVPKLRNFIKSWYYVREFREFIQPIQEQWYHQINPVVDWSVSDNEGTEFKSDAIYYQAFKGEKSIIDSANSIFYQFTAGNFANLSNSKRKLLFQVVLSQQHPWYINNILNIAKRNLDINNVPLNTDIFLSLGYCHPNQFPTMITWVLKNKPEVLSVLLDNLRPDQRYAPLVWEAITFNWSIFRKLELIYQTSAIESLSKILLLPSNLTPIIKFLKHKSHDDLKTSIELLQSRIKSFHTEFPKLQNKLTSYIRSNS